MKASLFIALIVLFAVAHFSDAAGCSKKQCRMRCKYGFMNAPDGCPMCKCRKAPCSDVLCMIHCPNGAQQDDNGCPMCKCRE